MNARALTAILVASVLVSLALLYGAISFTTNAQSNCSSAEILGTKWVSALFKLP